MANLESSAKVRAPYIIVAPYYTRRSAGVYALHFLADALNKLGYRTYVTCSRTNSGLNTPELTPEAVFEINKSGINPIIICPETVYDSPLGGSAIVRYILNYPGLLGGPKELNKDEFHVSWAKGMNPLATKETEQVLHIPVIDLKTFYPPEEGTKRSGTCYYWRKYKYFLKGKLEHPYPDSFEILGGDGPNVPTREKIAEIFRKSELFYCYENSSLSLEAMLCGCPVVLIPNEHLASMIANEELGTDGLAWGDDPNEIARARETVGKVQANYERLRTQFTHQLDDFVDKSQKFAQRKPFQAIQYYKTYDVPLGMSQKLLALAKICGHLLFSGKWRTLGQCLLFMIRSDLLRLKATLRDAYYEQRLSAELARARGR